MLRAYKYRLYPNKSQADQLNQHMGSTRFIYNYMLDLKIKAYDKDKTSLSRFDLQAKLPEMKNDKTWLKDRKWTCSSCGMTHDRDILAANNIKRFALEKIKIGQELPKFTLVEISSVDGRLVLAKPKKHLVSETRNLNFLNNQWAHIDTPLLVVG